MQGRGALLWRLSGPQAMWLVCSGPLLEIQVSFRNGLEREEEEKEKEREREKERQTEGGGRGREAEVEREIFRLR